MQIIIIFYYRLICLQTYGLMRMTTEGDCSSTWSITRWGWREWPWWWSLSLRTGNAGMQCRFLKQRKNLLKKNYWGKNCINLKYYTKCALKLWRHVWSSNYSVFVLFFFQRQTLDGYGRVGQRDYRLLRLVLNYPVQIYMCRCCTFSDLKKSRFWTLVQLLRRNKEYGSWYAFR